jgi:radical S-adenosyl methionine domain-containing protein 2
MNEAIEQLTPFRWKANPVLLKSGVHSFFCQVFQVLLLDGENTGTQSNSIRDARRLTISDQQFQSFLERHSGQASLVPESNEAMKDSYLNLDEEMRSACCFFIEC